MQKLQREDISSVNIKIVNSLAEIFLKHPDEYMPWLIQSCDDFNVSKTLFLLVVMQSFLQPEKGMFSNSVLSLLLRHMICFFNLLWMLRTLF